MRWQFHSSRIAALLKSRGMYDRLITSFDRKSWLVIERESANYLQRKPAFASDENKTISANPLVTALICNFNYGPYLARAIDSALNQTWQNLEIIVVDDGSTDNSREILKNYEGRIRAVCKSNGGQASAFNIGIKEAQGEIICFLDSDDFWYPQKVEHIIAKYHEAPWGLVCHDLLEVDVKGMNIRNVTHAQSTKTNMIPCDLQTLLVEHKLNWVFSPTSGMSLPTKIAKKLLPLPEREWRICADNPLAVGSLCHAPAGIVKKTLGAYRYHGENKFASKRQDQIANRIYGFLVKAERYCFLTQYLFQLGENQIDWSPKLSYRYYRLCCFITRNQPWRYLFKLYQLNIKENFINSRKFILLRLNSIKFIFIDSLLALLIVFNLPNPYTKLRNSYLKETSKLSHHVRTFLEKD